MLLPHTNIVPVRMVELATEDWTTIPNVFVRPVTLDSFANSTKVSFLIVTWLVRMVATAFLRIIETTTTQIKGATARMVLLDFGVKWKVKFVATLFA